MADKLASDAAKTFLDQVIHVVSTRGWDFATKATEQIMEDPTMIGFPEVTQVIQEGLSIQARDMMEKALPDVLAWFARLGK